MTGAAYQNGHLSRALGCDIDPVSLLSGGWTGVLSDPLLIGCALHVEHMQPRFIAGPASLKRSYPRRPSRPNWMQRRGLHETRDGVCEALALGLPFPDYAPGAACLRVIGPDGGHVRKMRAIGRS